MAAPKKAEIKKTAKAPAKKLDKKVNYRDMSAKDLQAALAEKTRDLLDSTRSLRANELVNPRVLQATRKEIARVPTAIRAAEAAQKESK